MVAVGSIIMSRCCQNSQSDNSVGTDYFEMFHREINEYTGLLPKTLRGKETVEGMLGEQLFQLRHVARGVDVMQEFFKVVCQDLSHEEIKLISNEIGIALRSVKKPALPKCLKPTGKKNRKPRLVMDRYDDNTKYDDIEYSD